MPSKRKSARDQRTQFYEALPDVVDAGSVMDDVDASAAMVVLETTNPKLAGLPKEIAHTVLGELAPDLVQDEDGNFVLTQDDLKGALNRTAIRAVVEVSDDIGRELYLDHEAGQLDQAWARDLAQGGLTEPGDSPAA